MTPLHDQILDIDDIGAATNALASLLDSHDPATPVPTCGEWTLADLVWHLTDVQSFWCHVIGNRPEGPETYDRPARPADTELAALLRSTAEQLTAHLHAAQPADAAWSWSDDHTVGFTIRRQVHESMIHGIDGMLAAGLPVPEVSPLLAADGIDEMITVMLTGIPDWAAFEPSDDVVALTATDTGDRWIMRAGTVSGIGPSTGQHLELPGYDLDETAAPTATIAAPALDLLLWMWGRKPQPALATETAASAGNALRQTIAAATQ